MRIITQGHNNAFFNIALDEAISEAVRKKLSPPTLRLYQWDKPSISIGYFQKISDINIDYCSKMGYPIVRRPTGGRAILHDSELTYSLSARIDSSPFKGRLIEDYTFISKALVSGLKLAGIDAQISFSKKRCFRQKSPACFKVASYGEITINGKKVIGSAQKRYNNGFLQQGSILLNFDARKLRDVLRFNDKEDFKEIGALREYAPEISYNDLKNSLKEAFEMVLKVKMISDNPTDFELQLAKELELKKYSTQEWNLRR
jgi:lipoate-protein ligase A